MNLAALLLCLGGGAAMRVIHQSSSSGFTLLETVIVLAIIGLMTAIAVPRYGDATNRYKAELTARRIAADLNLARSQAMASSTSQVVTFDLASNSYTLAGVVSLDGKSSNYVVNLAVDPYNCSLVSVNFNNTASVTFDAYGSADRGGQITLQCNGNQATVTLEPSSGKATVP